MTDSVLFVPVLLPVVISMLVFAAPKKLKWVRETIVLIAVSINLIVAILLFGKNYMLNIPWGGFGIDFSMRIYHFSSFILLATAGFAFLTAVYASVFMNGREFSKQFYVYMLITLTLVNGAVLANNLIVMLFFWEGLLVTLFAMIMTGGRKSFPTAVKAFVLVGVSDLFMMLGIGMTTYLAGTSAIDKIHLSLNSWQAGFAFILLIIGATSKAGSMPFHSWIPDAALDAPLPFMAFLPAALEKLLGIYLLARITLDLFDFRSGTSMSYLLMTIGAITILFAVMMALIQKNFKRLLSYHAISQVGYMILGIGTAVPAGIVGGLFHMINHAMYKSCLFLTGGSVEKQAGTTELKNIGGLGRKMPVTFGCFLVAAAAISGVPPFNGFFSKELIFDGALESGTIFYIAAAAGAFFTAASFLKLGHSAFLGKSEKNIDKVKEAPWPMLVPMIIIAGGCILFGVYNPLPLRGLIQPILGHRLEGHDFAGLPGNWILAGISIVVLAAAYLNHIYGVRKTGKGIGAVDHIHHAPVLSNIYTLAEKRYFDPYDIGMNIVKGASLVLWWIDRAIDRVYDVFAVRLAMALSWIIRRIQTGNQAAYLAWSLAGMVLVIILIVSM